MLWRRVRHKYALFTALTGFLLFPSACCRSTSKKKKGKRRTHSTSNHMGSLTSVQKAGEQMNGKITFYSRRHDATSNPTEQNMFVLKSAAYHILTFNCWSNTALTWRVRLKGYFNILSIFFSCCHNPYRHSLDLSMPWNVWWRKMEVPKSNNSESCGLHFHHAMK